MSGALWAPALWVGVLGIGGFGAMARFMVDRTVSRRMKGPFPFGTLVVNISGAALLGFLAGLTVSLWDTVGPAPLAWIMGGCTTLAFLLGRTARRA